MEKNINSKGKWYILFLIAIPVIIALLALKLFHAKPTVPPEPSQGGQYSYKNDSQVKYDQEGVKKIQELKQNKQPVSASDQKIKDVLTLHANPLAKTENYTITYNPYTDLFQADITTIRINTAKDEAVNWFKNQGFSDDAICKLPVEFTIDKKDAESLKGLNIIFNPLPPNCQ